MASTDISTTTGLDGASQKPTTSSVTPSSHEIPTGSELETILSTKVYDKDNKAHDLRSFVASSESHPRILTIFIRHFFCGNCQHYTRALASALSPPVLDTLDPKTQIVLIGCGDPSLITTYENETKSPYPIYANPDRSAYDALKFQSTLKQGPQPDYITSSNLARTFEGIKQSLGSGFKALKSGKIDQNGGEVVWEGGEIKWIHRMQNSTDHTEIKDLKKVLGLTS